MDPPGEPWGLLMSRVMICVSSEDPGKSSSLHWFIGHWVCSPLCVLTHWTAKEISTEVTIAPQGLHGGSDSIESACNAGVQGLIPESGRYPGEGNGYPLQYSCLENPMHRRACGLQSMGFQRVKHTRWLSTHTDTHTHNTGDAPDRIKKL